MDVPYTDRQPQQYRGQETQCKRVAQCGHILPFRGPSDLLRFLGLRARFLLRLGAEDLRRRLGLRRLRHSTLEQLQANGPQITDQRLQFGGKALGVYQPMALFPENQLVSLQIQLNGFRTT